MRRFLGVFGPGVAAAVLLAGCESGVLGPDVEELSGDPDATVAEIVDAGQLGGAAVSGERLLAVWYVATDYSEGPQHEAWRLYDEEGDQVAEGRLSEVSLEGGAPAVRAVDDGFLVERFDKPGVVHVDLEGAVSRVHLSRERRALAPGDEAVSYAYRRGYVGYHEADRTAYRLPRFPRSTGLVPGMGPEAMVADEAGRVSMIVAEAPGPDSSSGAEAPWRRETLPLEAVTVLGLEEGGGRLALPVGRTLPDTGLPEVLGVMTRPVDEGPAAWRLLRLEEGSVVSTWTPTVAFLPDGRLLVAGAGGDGAWLESDDGFEPVGLPRLKDARVVVAGDILLVDGSGFGDLRVSHDLGESWSDFP